MKNLIINELILDFAIRDIGIKEIKGNKGWYNKLFQKDMEKLTDWKDSYAWCISFCEKVWRQAYKIYDESGKIDKQIEKLIVASVTQTYKNFKADGSFAISQEPVIGAIVIWQTYKNGIADWTGHAAIVERINGLKNFETIDGNSNSEGGREGIEVARQIRTYNFDNNNGLRLIGFIHPKTV